eukprot:CAMPEP_0174743574 /NCGR_PEP_ID=MMETSP1094-20130205/81982_1 /TAXON_ID=156173 /ORGANISM="Chrysochromulina brevifilum, Strain UTEX LB 985" /LENGTH=48 /DNA_ID= /DNA_START= /DNA_END= /DNA_ORIENTATION=
MALVRLYVSRLELAHRLISQDAYRLRPRFQREGLLVPDTAVHHKAGRA